MSLDDVDLQCLLLEAVEYAKPARDIGIEVDLP